MERVKVLFSMLSVSLAAHAAGTWVAFGPQTFMRGSGAPTQVTANFSVLDPGTVYLLRINNGGMNAQFPRTTGVVTVNGVRIVGPLLLNPFIPVVELPIVLHTNNQVGVQLQGAPGSGIALQVIGVDLKPPRISASISPPPNSFGWNNSDVTVTFTCSDQTSGIASCPAPVQVTAEGAHQVVSGTAMDNAGNTTSTSVAINLDKTPPLISPTVSPVPDAGGWNSPPVSVSFACSDQLSGIASCSQPVTLTTEGPNQIATGTATDVAGNSASVQKSVNISTSYFTIRNYGGKCLDYGPNPITGVSGVFLNDCAAAHPVRVQEINSRHEVVLHAGALVIGVHHDTVITTGAPPPPPPTELALELQTPANGITTVNSPADQTFALDGDSIILASTRPCTSTGTTLCPPPPPQLVIQIQNARSANGSPLVAGIRALADSEFWDFNAIDNSGRYPTSGFVQVSTAEQLWNAICASPMAQGGPPLNPLDQTKPAACDLLNPLWGSVIVVANPTNPCNAVPGARPSDRQDVGACIDLSNYSPLVLPAGVTLRGDRRGTNLGPQLYAAYYTEKFGQTALPPTAGASQEVVGNCEICMLQVHGDYVRITGLRIRGQSRSTDDLSPTTDAIDIDFPLTYVDPDTGTLKQQDSASTTEYIAMIDHNDLSDWMATTINVAGGHYETLSCEGINENEATQANVRIERNFMHHNERKDLGYGAGMGNGGRAVLVGNTFEWNRHSIAADGELHEDYRARYNLVLSEAPAYDLGFLVYQDFDMHGTFSSCCKLFDRGNGGNYVEVYRNTFLGTDHHNYKLRGVPCKSSDFRDNISLESQDSLQDPGDAVDYTQPVPGFPINISASPDQFNHVNPTNRLGGGDFDGDRAQDLFLATGSAWYYAPAGNAEWRFLSGKTETLDRLLFGDFDGDGRTDVVALQNGQFVVSWAGISPWEVLNADPTGGRLLLLPAAVNEMAVGDFDGDGHADIFFADGTTWWVSYGGNTRFVPAATSSFRTTDLRFGDFDGDGATDVFGVVAGTWSYSKSATGNWKDGYLRPALTATVENLVVADFDGDGRADVAFVSAPVFTPGSNMASLVSWDWWFSYDGIQDWISQPIYPTSQCSLASFGPQQLQAGLLAGVGRFRGVRNADLLLWNSDNNFCIVTAGTGPAQRQSRQDMR